MYLNDHKIALAAMAESVKDADAIKELMSRAGIPVNNVTLVLIDSLRSAAFAAGREAMREELHECVKAEAWRAYNNAKPLEWERVDSAIRALPGKEG